MEILISAAFFMLRSQRRIAHPRLDSYRLNHSTFPAQALHYPPVEVLGPVAKGALWNNDLAVYSNHLALADSSQYPSFPSPGKELRSNILPCCFTVSRMRKTVVCKTALRPPHP